MHKSYYGPSRDDKSKNQNTNTENSQDIHKNNVPITTTYASTNVFSQTIYRKHAKETGKLLKK